MPWTPAGFRKKHCHGLSDAAAKRGAAAADAVLRATGDEGRAVRTGIAAAKKQHGKRGK